jgi:hypothetical protein
MQVSVTRPNSSGTRNRAALPKTMNGRISRQNLMALKLQTDVKPEPKLGVIRFFESLRSSLGLVLSRPIIHDKATLCAQRGGHVVKDGCSIYSSTCAECERPIHSTAELRTQLNLQAAPIKVRNKYWVDAR